MTEQEAKVERQRARERIKARRAYQRKMVRLRFWLASSSLCRHLICRCVVVLQVRLQSLRGEVTQLELQLERLSVQDAHDHRDDTSRIDHLALTAIGSAPVAFKTRKEVQERLRMLWEWGAQLRQSNNTLRRQFATRTAVAMRLEELLGRDERPYITFASQLLYLRPLTPAECAEIHHQAMEVVRMFSLNAVLSAPLIRQVSGWYERREVEGGLFRYALQKRFTHCGSVEALADKTFAMCTTPDGMRQFYTNDLDVQVRVIQKVDEDNYVLFQQMRAMDVDNELAVLKGLILVTRAQIANGFRIHIFSIKGDQLPLADHQAHEHPLPMDGRAVKHRDGENCPSVVEFWNNQFCWVQLEKLVSNSTVGTGDSNADTGCLMTYAGVTPTIGSNNQFWVSEVVLYCLRWEYAMMDPVFTLPLSE
jgi:hypothetical protein